MNQNRLGGGRGKQPGREAGLNVSLTRNWLGRQARTRTPPWRPGGGCYYIRPSGSGKKEAAGGRSESKQAGSASERASDDPECTIFGAARSRPGLFAQPTDRPTDQQCLPPGSSPFARRPSPPARSLDQWPLRKKRTLLPRLPPSPRRPVGRLAGWLAGWRALFSARFIRSAV